MPALGSGNYIHHITLDEALDAILADTAELQTDDVPTLIGALNDPTAAAIADAVWDEAASGHVAAGSFGAQAGTDIDAILADTGTDGVVVGSMLAAALADFFDTDSGTDYATSVAGSIVQETADNAGGSALTEAGIADAVWDEAAADHVTEDTMGNVVGDLTEESGGLYRFTTAALSRAPTGSAGSGSETYTYTLTSDVDSAVIIQADVWITSDEAGTSIVASGTTDGNGQVTFYLDPGTYYLWRQKPGWNFSNPIETTITS